MKFTNIILTLWAIASLIALGFNGYECVLYNILVAPIYGAIMVPFLIITPPVAGFLFFMWLFKD